MRQETLHIPHKNTSGLLQTGGNLYMTLQFVQWLVSPEENQIW